MINATISGHVGTTKLVHNDKFSVLNFTVASNSTTSKGDNVTNWVNAKLWGPRAVKLAPHLVSGQAVVISGRPEARGYLAKDGSAKGDLTLHVAAFEFAGKKPEGAPEVVAGEDAPSPVPAEAVSEAAEA